MRIAVPSEIVAGERRVALTPESVKRLVAKGLAVSIQRGAGAASLIPDADYEAAGARLEPDAASTWRAGELVVKVRAPTPHEIDELREHAGLISLIAPFADPDRVFELARRRGVVLAADLVPRTSAAQMMDVLSSQATLAGYRAVLLAAEASPKLFPMMMTAAGTIAPARVLVLGAGVAGLQAIATARRLGAVVEAFDVRRVVKEQVESLGAKFIEVPIAEDGAAAGGYAREMSPAYQAAQAELLGAALARCDAAITTAQVPGRVAPTLITADHVARMKPGAVIVDLAAEQGGNCALTRTGERVVTERGVLVVGDTDLPSQLAVHASQMFSKNLEKLIVHLVRDGALHLDPADEIAQAMMVCRGGVIVHPRVAQAVAQARKELAA
jgi:NAD(P) transhydrogenase subunit alpha